jgi:alpha-aminoadipate/glutamate carrier protein LysW
MAICPECEADIDVDEFDVNKGDQISCPECGTNLEVTAVAPIEFDVASDEDEDEDDLDEDEDEDDEDEEEDEDLEE